LKKPYIKLYKKVNGFKAYLVDGQYIRKNLDDQFTNFGQHYRFPKMIPANEFWLDKDYGEKEYQFYIPHMMKEWELMKQGKSYKYAITEADKLEKGLRKEDEKESCKLKKLDDIGDLAVWVVDGKQIRDRYDIDFTEGGHDKVYSWIPDREIWISDEISAKERPYVLAHEYDERCSMSKGEDYEKAHNKASFFERHLRHMIPNIGRLNAKKSGHKKHSHGRVNESKSLGQMR
jgi:hypothetical protein